MSFLPPTPVNPEAEAREKPFYLPRNFPLRRNLWVYIMIRGGHVSINLLRRRKSEADFERGVTMNIEELHWFTQDDLPPSGSFGNIRVTKKRLSWEVKTVSPLQKSQPIIITIQAFALLRSHKKTITRDIDEGLAFLEKLATPDNRESNNLSLFQNIIVLLANKIYKHRVKSICIPCMRADGENINEFPTIHGCATEDNFTKSLRGRESLRAVTNDLLKCVLLCNNITPPKQDVMEIVGENHTEVVGKVVQGLISCEAQRCFEVYYDVNSAVF